MTVPLGLELWVLIVETAKPAFWTSVLAVLMFCPTTAGTTRLDRPREQVGRHAAGDQQGDDEQRQPRPARPALGVVGRLLRRRDRLVGDDVVVARAGSAGRRGRGRLVGADPGDRRHRRRALAPAAGQDRLLGPLAAR